MMTQERLGPLCLLPPATDTPWRGLPNQSTVSRIARQDQSDVLLDLPLFWYSPGWYRFSTEVASEVAASVARQGITVSALRSEITAPQHPSAFHDSPDDAASKGTKALPRIVPYRPERYGLDATDFDSATIVDLRLTLARDQSGRFAFPAKQVARWESATGKTSISGGGWVDSTSFPPDVIDFQHLEGKLNQLRQLSPDAALFVSLNPVDLDHELPRVLAANPDGIILRLDRFAMGGLSLATLIRKTRQRMTQDHSESIPLWIVPGTISPDDGVKMIALGASAVAVDHWCLPLREADYQTPESSAERLGLVQASEEILPEYVDEVVASCIAKSVTRFTGLYLSLQRENLTDTLGSFDNDWAEALDVRPLG